MPVDRKEARDLLSEKMKEYQAFPYATFVSWIASKHVEVLEVGGRSGRQYMIEILAQYEDWKEKGIRVMAAIDDGSIPDSFTPLCDDFIIEP